jgi:hypothetical protein
MRYDETPRGLLGKNRAKRNIADVGREMILAPAAVTLEALRE